jgi:glycosyltransferase involved in cell wall biosynthesis
VPKRKLYVVANGTIGSPRLRPLATYEPATLMKPAIVTVAGMNRRKGISVLLKAFESVAAGVPDAHLYLVGEGPDRAGFEAEAALLASRERIHFEGYQGEPQRYLRASDVFVLASFSDPFPLVIPEAREAGCAIVASRVDGIPQALDDGNAGLLFTAGNDAELAEQLRSLLTDPEKRSEWSARARHNLAWLRADRVAAETLAVYRSA